MGNVFSKTKVATGSTGRPHLEISLFGDWAKVIKTLQRLSPDIKDASIKAQTKVAKEICKRVKAHLRNQDLSWEELSETYAAKKSEAGLDGRTLMAYKTYYDAIQTWTKGNQHMVFVGVKKGIYGRNLEGKRTKLEVAAYAAIHEFSSGRRIPKRPLWNPTIKELGGAKGIKKMYLGSLLAHLRLKGIPITEYRNLF